ncbi:MAG: DNA methyltransferase, partial [Promethearchaeota archaeon]
MKFNTVYLGDNLNILREMESEIVDLIYIDPPFYSGVDYGEFSDKWKSFDEYLSFMEIRIKEMHRVLKDTGSFYLHCDPSAVFELKILCD